MADGERVFVDAAGEYRYVRRDGTRVAAPDWRSCRIVLTGERLILASGDSEQAIPHGQIRLPDHLPEELDADGATPLEIGDHLILVDVSGIADFEAEYCRAAVSDEVILVEYGVVSGGGVQEDGEWSKARVRFDDDRVVLGLAGNRTASFAVEDVGSIETSTDDVLGHARRVVTVVHTDENGRAVETRFSGTTRHTRALATLLRGGLEDRKNDVELDEHESQVLVALYSGVSPFEMADFVGLEVDEVEAIYQRLLEIGAVDKVRERTEVTLNAQGRNLASEAMNEE